MVKFTPKNVRLDNTTAAPPPSSVNIPKRPRRPSGAYSALNSAEPAHSPPTANPCSKRSATKINGAATPMVAVLGTAPTDMVETAMISKVAISVFFRPSRSPK